MDARTWLAAALRQPTLTRQDRELVRLLVRLPSFPFAFPSLRKLGEMLDPEAPLSVDQTRRRVRHLEAAGLLARAERFSDRQHHGDGRQLANDYWAVLPAPTHARPPLALLPGPSSRRGDPKPAAERGATRPAAAELQAPPPPPAATAAPVQPAALACPAGAPLQLEPALVGRLQREHGPHAEAMVRTALARPEALQHPEAAAQALQALLTFKRSEVRKSVGHLLTWLVREAIAGRQQLGTLVDTRTPMARLDQAIDNCEQIGQWQEAARLRAVAFELGRQAERERDERELREDPRHRQMQALIDATIANRVALPPPPAAREPERPKVGVVAYVTELLAKREDQLAAHGVLTPGERAARALTAGGTP